MKGDTLVKKASIACVLLFLLFPGMVWAQEGALRMFVECEGGFEYGQLKWAGAHNFGMFSQHYGMYAHMGEHKWDVIKIRLPQALTAGSYRLFARVFYHWQAPRGPNVIEVGLNGRTHRFTWDNSVGGPVWLPGRVYEVPEAGDQLTLRALKVTQKYAAVDCFYITSDLTESAPPEALPEGDVYSLDNTPPQYAGEIVEPALEVPEVSVIADRPDWRLPGMYLRSDRPLLRLRYSSTDTVSRVLNITGRVVDYYGGEVQQISRRVVTRGRDFLTINIPIHMRKFGPHRAEVEIASTDGLVDESFQVMFGLLPDGIPAAPKPDSLFGMHTGFSEFYINIAARMGVKWTRCWNVGVGTTWTAVEPQPGRWRWQDDRLQMCLDQGIIPIGLLELKPDWAPNYLADDGDKGPWLNYIKHVVAHYAGKIDHWELFNEHYGTGCPRETQIALGKKYAGFLKLAGPVIRQANPNAKIVAPCGTGPESASALGFFEGFFAAGGLKYTDFLSGHFYIGSGGSHPIDRDRQLDEYMVAVREMLDRYGGQDIDIWDTESGMGPMESFYRDRRIPYGYFSGAGYTPRAPVPRDVAVDMMARFAVVHLFNNVRWFYYELNGNYAYSWALCEATLDPLPPVYAYAFCAALLEDAKPVTRLAIPGPPGSTIGFAFKKDGKQIAAVWGLGLKKGEKRTLTAQLDPGKVNLYDPLGNVVTSAETDRVVIECGRTPTFIQATQADVDLVSALNNADLAIDTSEVPPLLTMDWNLAGAGSENPPQVTASSTADGYDLARVNDGVTEGYGEEADTWASAEGDGQHWVEFRWDKPLSIDKVVLYWAQRYQPNRYVVQWWDGSQWHNTSFYPRWRQPGQPVENCWINRVTTDRLRVVQDAGGGSPETPNTMYLVEFKAFTLPLVNGPQDITADELARMYSPDEEGFIRDWLVAGPFPSPGTRWTKSSGWDRDFLRRPWTGTEGETGIRPYCGKSHAVSFPPTEDEVWTPREVRVAWRPLHSAEAKVDFGPFLRNEPLGMAEYNPEQVAAYAACYVKMPQETECRMSLGSDDGVKVWLNGKLVHANLIYRGAVRDQDEVSVMFQEGWNLLLAKVINDIGGHALYLRLLDDEGQPLTDYEISLAPQ